MINRRGITPIIAMILLLMMTVAASAAAFYWLVKIQGQMQGGAEQYQEKSFERMASTMSWIDANFNRTSENITIYIQNEGTTEIPLDSGSTDPTTSWILKDKDQDVVCSTKLDGAGTNAKCTSGCSGTSTPSQVNTLILKTNGTACDTDAYANDTLFYITIYFSGKASTAGTFEK